MPEFILDRGGSESAAKFNALDSFTQGYIEAMFFTGSGDEDDLESASIADLAPSAWERIKDECAKFQMENATLLETAYTFRDGVVASYDDESAGRDFWYNRNGHGVGYWCRDLGEIGDRLDVAAHIWHELYLVRGGDGLIYLE